MSNAGKRLEALVSFIEEWLARDGASVRTNVKEYDQGIQVAEFDVVVESTIKGQPYKWLIECRDRPASGAAPTSWIEQLIGRRIARAFDKVTAVSTTGFTHGATTLAIAQGIELREVHETEPEQFIWEGIDNIGLREHVLTPGTAEILCRDEEPKVRKDAFYNAVTEQGHNVLLRPSDRSAASLTARMLFDEVTLNLPDELLVLEPGQAYSLVIDLNYRGIPSYFVETRLGPMAVERICFYPTVQIVESDAIVEETLQYLKKSPTQKEISRKATLRTHSVNGGEFSVELHRLAESGKLRLQFDRVK